MLILGTVELLNGTQLHLYKSSTEFDILHILYPPKYMSKFRPVGTTKSSVYSRYSSPARGGVLLIRSMVFEEGPQVAKCLFLARRWQVLPSFLCKTYYKISKKYTFARSIITFPWE
jgi:hypothetical protein